MSECVQDVRGPVFSPLNGEVLIDVQIAASQRASAARELLAQKTPGPFAYLYHLRLPDFDDHDFRMKIVGYPIGEIASTLLYCDAAKLTPGAGYDGSTVVLQAVTSGGMTFESASQVVEVTEGQICVRETCEEWEVRCRPHTTSRLVVVPRTLMRDSAIRRIEKRGLRFGIENPELQFIINYLEFFETERKKVPSGSRDVVAQDGLATLISSALEGDREHTSRYFDDLTVVSARKIMQAHLLDDELSPSLIAQKLAVSLRNLHRSFARVDSSVMEEVRQLRLQGAYDDLVGSDHVVTVSAVAAKWKFSDASHFVRRFKAEYGDTPASYARRRAPRRENP